LADLGDTLLENEAFQLRLDLGDALGANLVGYGTDTVKKALDKLYVLANDMTNVKDFGAKGDRTADNTGTDDTAAFASAIAAALAQGRPLYVPPGNYRIASALPQIVLPAAGEIRGDGRSVGIIGAGSHSTVITYQGAGNLFDFLPQASFTPFTIRGLRLRRPLTSYASIPSGSAVKIGDGLFGFVVEDVQAVYFDTGFEISGALHGVLRDSGSWWCLTGAKLRRPGSFAPNQITFDRHLFTRCRDVGADIRNCSGIVFRNCILEQNGDLPNNIRCTPVLAVDMGGDGVKALSFVGSNYFEANYSNQHIYITHTIEAQYDLGGCMFNRVGTSDAVLSDVVFDANFVGDNLGPAAPKATLDVRGATFNSLFGNVRTALKPRLNLGLGTSSPNSYTGLTIQADGAVGLDGADGPVGLPPVVNLLSELNRVSARARFGGTGVLGAQVGVVSCVRNSVGNYTFTLARSLGTLTDMSFTALTTNCVAKVVNDTATTVQVVTHIGGTPTDTDGLVEFTGTRL